MSLLVGLERLTKKQAKPWQRCALVYNQASVTKKLAPAWKVLENLLGKNLTTLFGPQHGAESTVQDNMLETGHMRHLASGLPIFSLYSETREPTEEMLKGCDTIIFDMQITGCRIYTYKATLAACLRAAKKWGKKVVVLDRPNPNSGTRIEGRVLDLRAKSFVGEYATPMRHGLTPAECALFFNKDIGAELEVIKMQGWRADSFSDDYKDHPWVLTSPNIPTRESVYVFPGTVLFEGTNLSEGRGTTLPFQFIGAPYIKNEYVFTSEVLKKMKGRDKGIFLRPCQFEPTSQKWQGKTCKGFQIHVLDPKKIQSFSLAVAVINVASQLAPQDFSWKQPPYEYDYTTLPIKLIFGDLEADKKLTASDFSLDDPYWSEGCKEFVKASKNFHLYNRKKIEIFR